MIGPEPIEAGASHEPHLRLYESEENISASEESVRHLFAQITEVTAETPAQTEIRDAQTGTVYYLQHGTRDGKTFLSILVERPDATTGQFQKTTDAATGREKITSGTVDSFTIEDGVLTSATHFTEKGQVLLREENGRPADRSFAVLTEGDIDAIFTWLRETN